MLSSFEEGCSPCEVAKLLGDAGDCVVSAINGSVECLCSEGFTGKDDWFDFPDSCHVNKSVQKKLHFAGLVCSCTSTLIIALTVTYLGIKWRLFPFDYLLVFLGYEDARFRSQSNLGYEVYSDPAPAQISNLFSSVNSRSRLNSLDDQVPRVNSNTKLAHATFLNRSSQSAANILDSPNREQSTAPVQRKPRFKQYDNELMQRNLQRKKFTYITCIAFLVGNVGYIGYLALLMQGYSRSDDFFLLDFFTLLASSPILGIHFWFYAVLQSIPNMYKFGMLLSINNLFVRVPNLFPILLLITGILYFMFIFLACILPLAFNDKRENFMYAQWASLIIFLLPVVIMFEYTLYQIKIMLSKAKTSIAFGVVDEPGNSLLGSLTNIMPPLPRENIGIQVIKSTLNSAGMFRMGLYSSLITLVMVCLLAYIYGVRFNYLFFTILVIMGSLSSIIFMIYIAVYKQIGLTPTLTLRERSKVISQGRSVNEI